MLLGFNCHSLLHKNIYELSFCYRFMMKQRQKDKVNKVWNWLAEKFRQQMQNVKMYSPVSLGIAWNAWQKTIRKGIVWNDSHFTKSFQASRHTYFFKFSSITACLFGSTYNYMKWTFLVSVWLHNIFICVRIEYSTSMTQKRSLD